MFKERFQICMYFLKRYYYCLKYLASKSNQTYEISKYRKNPKRLQKNEAFRVLRFKNHLCEMENSNVKNAF